MNFVTQRKPHRGSETELSPEPGAVRSDTHLEVGHPKGGDATTHPALRDLFRSMAAVTLCIVAAHLLAGCGGGDPEPDVATPSVNCALQPVACQ